MVSEDPPEQKLKPHGKDYFHPDRRTTKSKKAKPSTVRWVLLTIGWTFVISILFSFISNTAISRLSILPAMLILLMFILLGILFDIIGIAVATADEKPFHSMATRRVKGAHQSLRLIRSAEKVSSFCNDVVGDISGIISGATTSVIATGLIVDYSLNSLVTQLIFSAVVASLTVGGKAAGKTFAMKNNTRIVQFVGVIMYHMSRITRIIRKPRL